jgi:hypothetical protein
MTEDRIKAPEDMEMHQRGILIHRLPIGIELRDVLARVCVGKILRCLITPRNAVGGVTANLVVHAHQTAVAFADSIHGRHLIYRYDNGEEQRAIAVLMSTAMHPSDDQTNKLLDMGCTRCLTIKLSDDTTRLAAARLLASMGLLCPNCGLWRNVMDCLVDLWVDETKALHLEFKTIVAAGQLMDRINDLPSFIPLCDCTTFSSDPCAGYLGVLRWPTPRKSASDTSSDPLGAPAAY